MTADVLVSAHWSVRPPPHAEAAAFIATNHYARGASKTSVYRFGLFHFLAPSVTLGVTLWLPPTKAAACSVDPLRWRQVLALSRMAVAPGVPKNARSFLLARDDRPTWPITAAAVGAFLGVMLKCAVALLGGDGVVASGGLWAFAALCATGALHYERQVSNALRRELRSRGHG